MKQLSLTSLWGPTKGGIQKAQCRGAQSHCHLLQRVLHMLQGIPHEKEGTSHPESTSRELSRIHWRSVRQENSLETASEKVQQVLL